MTGRPKPLLTRRAVVVSLSVMYACSGLSFSTWLSRMPSVRQTLGVGVDAMAGLLAFAAAGSLAMVVLAGPVAQRLGSKTCFYLSAAAQVVAMAVIIAGLARASTPVVGVGMFANGMANALQTVPLNAEGALIERAAAKALLSRFHAVFALGALSAAWLGSAMAWLGVRAETHFACLSLAVLAARLVCIPRVLRGPDGVAAPGGKRRARAAAPGGAPKRRAGAMAAWTEPRTLLIGLVALAFSSTEASASNWLTIAMVDGFATSEAVAALILSAFQIALLGGRWFGLNLIARWGRVVSLRASAVLAMAGVALVAFSPVLPLAAVGAVAWGAGVAIGYPATLGAVADDPERSVGRVAVISASFSAGSQVAPPVIGVLSRLAGIRSAFLALLAVMALAGAASRHVRVQPTQPNKPGQPAR